MNIYERYYVLCTHQNEENNGYQTGKELAKVILDTFNIVVSDRTVQNIRNKMGTINFLLNSITIN